MVAFVGEIVYKSRPHYKRSSYAPSKPDHLGDHSHVAKKKEFPLPHLKNSKLVIAICQIETNGKHKTLIGNRNSFGWRNIEDVNNRVRKAVEIVDALNRLPQQHIDLIVFPEYSLPVERVLPELQTRAQQYKQMIIPGTDNIVQTDGKTILNQCPIILPNKRVIWVTKRQLSPWEHGYIDEPENVAVPKLTWKADDGHKYWVTVSICLDFNLTKKEYSKGGGIVVVPMCSPDVDSFRGWADDLLRLEDGTATILCNGFGDLGIGSSSLIAMMPDGKPFKPAFELPKMKEAIAVFDIDCRHLAPPKKTNPEFPYPLGKTYFYSLISTSGRIELKTLQIREKDVVTRGVINPAIFESLDKKTRMAFLSIDNFWESVSKLENQDFEVLAILGQHDLLITHLHENRYDMIYDVKKVVNWKMSVDGSGKSENDLIREIHDKFPFFRVDVYFKVLGAEIPRQHSNLEDRMPNLEERIQIIKLGSNWNDEQVSEEEKERFLRRGWILKPTDKKPGDINAIMTISLEHLGPEMGDKQAMFEEKVIPQIIKKPIVTSAYRGRPQILTFSYVFRIWASIEELHSLIEEIYQLASEVRVAVNTSTYVVLKHLSTLSLEKAVLSPSLTPEETAYRNRHITPKLSADCNDRLRSLTKDTQSEYIGFCRRAQDAMTEVEEIEWIRRRYQEIEKKLLEGLLNSDFELLKEVHVFFHDKVETRFLKEFIDNEISELDFEQLKTRLQIQTQRTKKQLTYRERMAVVLEYLKTNGGDSRKTKVTKNLLKTNTLRNAITHGNYDNIPLEEYVEALSIYCEFIRLWNK